MAPKKVIEIKCKGAATVDHRILKDFQGELKSLSVTNYRRLRRQIAEHGFSEPISVWVSNGTHYVLNGHQRLRALVKMASEGYAIPPIPISIIEADDYAEASHKTLALTSQYGEMESEGLYEFMVTRNLDPQTVETDFRFPEIDNAKYLESFHTDPGAAPDPKTKKFILLVRFDDADTRQQVFDRLMSAGLDCEIK